MGKFVIKNWTELDDDLIACALVAAVCQEQRGMACYKFCTLQAADMLAP